MFLFMLWSWEETEGRPFECEGYCNYCEYVKSCDSTSIYGRTIWDRIPHSYWYNRLNYFLSL